MSAVTENLIADKISALIEPLGYEVVAVEIQNHRQRTLRVFIDFIEPKEGGIGIEDCVAVTRALDEPLENDSDIDSIFKTGYELEVSSPGVERPLRRKKDFVKYAGELTRIHVYRPLDASELGNPEYFEKNSKQKNFIGQLGGVTGDSVDLIVTTQKNARISIPLALISKANIELGENFKDLLKGTSKTERKAL